MVTVSVHPLNRAVVAGMHGMDLHVRLSGKDSTWDFLRDCLPDRRRGCRVAIVEKPV